METVHIVYNSTERSITTQKTATVKTRTVQISSKNVHISSTTVHKEEGSKQVKVRNQRKTENNSGRTKQTVNIWRKSSDHDETEKQRV